MTPAAPAGARPPSDGRVWPTRDLIWLLMSTLGLAFVAGALAGPSDDTNTVLRLLALSTVAIGAPAALLVAARRRRVAAVGLVSTSSASIGQAALYGLALLPALGLLNLAIQLVFGAGEHPQAGLMFDRMTGGQLAFAAVFSVLLVPFVEELLFRGVLLSALLERGPADPEVRRRRAVIVSSVVFGLFHVDPHIIPATAVLGAVAAILRLRSGSLWPAVTLHGLNNAVATAILAAGAA